MSKLSYKVNAVLKGNKKAFFDTLKKVSKITHVPRFFIFFDMMWCLIRYGAGHNDYRVFAFYDLTEKQRNTYLTRFRNKKIIDELNNPAYSKYFDNKAIFNKRFSNYLKRDTADIKEMSLKEFEKFIKEHNPIFCKPYNGDSGKGIEKLDVNDFRSPSYMYDYIKKKNIGVLEEIIVQNKTMAKVNPNAVNCMRLVTVLNGDKVDVLYGVIKFGTTSDYVDNMGRGGSVSGPIDLETGEILYDLKNAKGDVFSEHPVSKIVFKGFKIPKFKEAINLVTEAAKEIKEVRQVGWDICISDKGACIVEGNNWTDYMFAQLPEHTKDKVGLMPYYRKILKDK